MLCSAKDIPLLKTLFFLLGCAVACFVLTVGIAYTDATGFPAVNAPYLAGGYPLVWVFNLTAFFAGLTIVIDRVRRRKNSTEQN